MEAKPAAPAPARALKTAAARPVDPWSALLAETDLTLQGQQVHDLYLTLDPPARQRLLLRLARAFLAQPDAEARFRTIVEFLAPLPDQPPLLIDWMTAASPAHEFTMPAQNRAIAIWATASPATAAAWLAERPAHLQHADLAGEVAAIWAKTQPVESWQWAASLNEDLLTASHAVAALPPAHRPSALIEELVGWLAAPYPQEALQWAQTIPDDEIRLGLLRSLSANSGP
jgi:hypothetical protein